MNAAEIIEQIKELLRPFIRVYPLALPKPWRRQVSIRD